MKKIISGVLLFAILAISALALVSCGAPNKDPEKAAQALKDEGYTVSNMTKDGVGVITATKLNDTKKSITIIYCSDDDFDDEYEYLKKKWDDKKDNDDYADYEFGKSGKMVYLGHKDAIKAAQ